MNQQRKPYFIPVLTSEAGTCLTLKNWQEIGVEVAAYYLNSLLTKPGLQLLTHLPNLQPIVVGKVFLY